MRTIEVDLTALAAVRAGPLANEPWRAPTRALAEAATWSGPVLGLARLLDAARRGADLPFVVAIGNAVRRGLPTAARATILARSPLTGDLSDGQVGSDLARRLASIADALILTGTTGRAECVLVLDARGAPRLEHVAGLARASMSERLALLASVFPSSSALVAGRAGDRGVPFANLAAGEGAPSFVGRGGLGAALAGRGLVALVVCAPLVPVESDARARMLLEKLVQSPRLRARAEHGTLELAHAFAARGVLSTSAAATRLEAETLQVPSSRKGCAGCPTPCGWVFESDKSARGLRFSAWQPIGGALGIERLEDVLAVVARCDDHGLDARETAAVLALLDAAIERGEVREPPLRGDRDRCLSWIDAIVTPPTGDESLAVARALALGAQGCADWLGARARAAVPVSVPAPRIETASADVAAHASPEKTTAPSMRSLRGQSVRDDGSVASLLALCTSSRGNDPMRASLFALHDTTSRADLERLLAPLALPSEAERLDLAVGKGRIVWWHENVAAALDATGFCAFSAAGLLVDDVLDVPRLAELVLPSAWLARHGPGDRARAFQAFGASIVALQRELGATLRKGARAASPEWALDRLLVPGALDEYELLRGVDPRSGAVVNFERVFGTLEILDRTRPYEIAETHSLTRAAEEARSACTDRPSVPLNPALAPGVVRVRAGGALARRLGREMQLEVDVPVRVAEFVRELARSRPEAAHWLVREQRVIVAVLRAGRRLEPDELLNDAEMVDLVVAISGG